MEAVVRTVATPSRTTVAQRRRLHSAVMRTGEWFGMLALLLSETISLGVELLRARCGGLAARVLPLLGAWGFFLMFAGQAVRNSIGFVGYGITCALSFLLMVTVLVASGRTLSLRRIPLLPVLYALVCMVSVAWSAYRLETAAAGVMMLATTAVGLVLAASFPMHRILDLLVAACQWIVTLSFGLELAVALLMPGRSLAPVYLRDADHVPDFYVWVHGVLFQGGPIQGIVGNRNPLAFVAALLLIGVIGQHLLGRSSRVRTTVWISVAGATLALTRSATVTVLLVASMGVLVALVALRRLPRERRRVWAIRLLVALALLAVVALASFQYIGPMLGRSSDMSGRGIIWERVLVLWEKRPVLGWGWILCWAPWLPLYRTLVVRFDGTPTMQAHNAWLDSMLQTGLVGLVVLVLLVGWVTVSIFRTALSAPAGDRMPLVAAMLVTALVVQSFTESHLLSEGNWVLLVVLAAWVHLRSFVPDLDEVEAASSRRDGQGLVELA